VRLKKDRIFLYIDEATVGYDKKIAMITSNPEHDSTHPIQNCGSCGRMWYRWPDFILDPEIRLLGFQMITELPDSNLLVFEHRCGSSVSVMAKRLRHLLTDGGAGAGLTSLAGTTSCRKHCLSLTDFEHCDSPCVNARDRRLVQMVLEMKRAHGGHKTHGRI
jgi:hypothetical protein